MISVSKTRLCINFRKIYFMPISSFSCINIKLINSYVLVKVKSQFGLCDMKYCTMICSVINCKLRLARAKLCIYYKAFLYLKTSL